MKTKEVYLQVYDQKLNNLIAKGEEWRIRVTRQEFLSEIERLRIYESDEMNSKRFNEYHIQSNIRGGISIMFMDRVTHEEAREQARRLREQVEKLNQAEIPEIIEKLKLMQLPITFNDILNLYNWLFYKQINFFDIPENVLNEFKKTRHYEMIIQKNKE